MKQEEFTQVMCELAYQFYSDEKCKISPFKFIDLLRAASFYQPVHIELMIEETIFEMEKK